MAGNSTTSRIDSDPVSSITSRSIPSPRPPVGASRAPGRPGSPRPSAGPRRRRRHGRPAASRTVGLIVGIVELGERVGELHPARERLEPLDGVGIVGGPLGERRQRQRVVEQERRLDQGRLERLGESRRRASPRCRSPARRARRRASPPAGTRHRRAADVDAARLVDRRPQVQSPPRRGEVDRVPAPVDVADPVAATAAWATSCSSMSATSR